MPQHQGFCRHRIRQTAAYGLPEAPQDNNHQPHRLGSVVGYHVTSKLHKIVLAKDLRGDAQPELDDSTVHLQLLQELGLEPLGAEPQRIVGRGEVLAAQLYSILEGSQAKR
ncbi:hypothetical protein PG990_011059 [Apiospora arundinis]